MLAHPNPHGLERSDRKKTPGGVYALPHTPSCFVFGGLGMTVRRCDPTLDRRRRRTGYLILQFIGLVRARTLFRLINFIEATQSTQRWAYYCSALLVSLVLAWFALIGFPKVGGDAAFFMPVATMISAEGSWLSPLYDRSYELTPVGEPAFTWHGFLYPAAYGLLFADLTGPELFSGTLLLVSGTFCLMGYLFYRESHGLNVSVRASALFFIGIPYLLTAAGLTLGYIGRPEPFALAISTGALVALCHVKRPVCRDFITGLALAAVAITSPIPAIALGSLTVMCYAARSAGPVLYLGLFRVFGSGLVTLCVAFWFIYPFGVQVWTLGLIEHAGSLSGHETSTYFRFQMRFLFDNRFPLLLLPVSLAIYSFWKISSSQKFGTPWLFYFATLIFVAAIYWIIPKGPLQTYYLIPLIPLAGLAMLSFLMRLSVSSSAPTAIIVSVAFGLLLVPASTGFLRHPLLAIPRTWDVS